MGVCLKFDIGRLDFLKNLGGGLLQDLTKIIRMAEEQCCCGLATARTKRVGGYRVGFRRPSK